MGLRNKKNTKKIKNTKDTNNKEFKEVSSGVKEVLKRHKNRVNSESFNKHKNILFILSIISGLFLVLFVYFILPASYIKSISIEGNDYLSKEYIKNISGLNSESRYYLTFSKNIEKNLNKNPLIKNSKVTYLDNNIIKIFVEENKPIAYRHTDKPQLLLNNGKIIDIEKDFTNIISRVPLLEGFTDNQQEYLINKSLSKLDKNILENISEIKQYEINYDSEMLMIYLRDGNYFFSSYYGIEVLNSYNLIASQIVGDKHCIFADESLKVAYRKVCPWDEVKKEFEYWTDENGEYILNKYGDKVVVHYVKDENGQFVLDEQGNKIRIPIDKYGNEIPYEPVKEETTEETSIQE